MKAGVGQQPDNPAEVVQVQGKTGLEERPRCRNDREDRVAEPKSPSIPQLSESRVGGGVGTQAWLLLGGVNQMPWDDGENW